MFTMVFRKENETDEEFEKRCKKEELEDRKFFNEAYAKHYAKQLKNGSKLGKIFGLFLKKPI